VELDRVEQSLARVRSDLASKRKDVTSLKMREASQPEVCIPRNESFLFLSWFFRVLKSLPGWPASRRALGPTTVRLYIARSCNCADLYQSFRMPRLSSPPWSRLKKTCPPNSDTSNSGLLSRHSIGHGRAGYSFLCATPRGSTASSAVLLCVLIILFVLSLL
jgi:hypothetical protein